MIQVKEITDGDAKRKFTRRILADLPRWFGIPEAVDCYVASCADLSYYAAFANDEAVGFVAIKQHYPTSAEIYVMGVDERFHRQGIGRALVDACREYCRQHGIEYLQVKTLAETHPDASYAKTRAFYAAMGFRPLECLPELWNPSNPCLIMVQHIPA